MKAAILTIGDELTCGYQLDTNSQFIAQRLGTLPADVVLHLSVGDDAKAIRQALHVAIHATSAADEPAVIVVSGGLGPTEDDLTRRVIATHFGLALVEDAGALALIQQRFAHRNLEMPESNRIQALVPAGSRPIYNERGTAAGFYLQVMGHVHVFVTPGVPYEMEGMVEAFVLPRLREMVRSDAHVHRAFLRVYGLPESEINERIRPLMERERNPLLGLLPDLGTITIEIVATADKPEEADALVQADVAALRAELGQYIVSDDGRGLPQVVADLLTERDLTIAVAEVGTGGLVAARLYESTGSLSWFCGGTVLGDDGLEDAQALVLAAREATVADVGVGVGPIIIPPDSVPASPYGLIDVVVNVHGREVHRRLRINGDRDCVRRWAADSVLDQVRVFLLAS
jgi:nicotinamide-nucleotide amidase